MTWLLSAGLVLAAAVALLGWRAYFALRRERDQLRNLLQAARATESVTGLEAAVTEVLRHARVVFGASFAELQLPLDEGEVLLATLRRGDDLPSYARVPAANPDLRRRLRRRGLRSTISAPVDSESGKGVLLIASPVRRAGFDADAAASLQAFAAQAGATFDQARRHEQYRHRAFHDPLTNLANRALFADRVDQAIRRTLRHGGMPAVLLLDLDDFKLVNDTLGHGAGDQLLVEVAGRLRACIRPDDTAARLGGDEFAVLVEAAHGVAGATAVAERIIAALGQPFSLAGRQLDLRASIGIALTAGEGTCADLLRRADAAMYLAKREGKSRWALAAAQPTVTIASA